MSNIYEKTVWDAYKDSFAGFTSSHMVEIYKYIEPLASGDVINFGCGSYKTGPYLLDNPRVTSLTGIDYSLDMVNKARWFLKQFQSSDNDKPIEIIHGKIEDIENGRYELEIIPGIYECVKHKRYDFGLSINSLYAWNNPEAGLTSIHNSLKLDASFVLINPNPRLNMEGLLRDARREQLGNPLFQSFATQNEVLVGNEKALFLELDDLIDLVRRIGFKVKKASDSKFYNGGLNYLHLVA